MAHTANTCWDRRGDGHGPARAFNPITKNAARSHLAATGNDDGRAATATSRRRTDSFWTVCVQCRLGGFRLGEGRAKDDLLTEISNRVALSTDSRR